MRALPAAIFALVLTACGSSPTPVAVDPHNDTCAWCRMAVSDPRLAAQVVAPLEEPRLFDDIGCLRDFLAGGGTLPAGALAYVADHRTGAWVPARQAVYVQTPALSTPMGSGIAAWADAASRSLDDGVPPAPLRPAAELLGAAP
jgi:copper chaperone NosL